MKHSQWRRALLVAAVVASGVAAISGFLPATSAHADSACPGSTSLEVHLPGGTTKCLTVGDLSGEPTVSGEYYIRSSADPDNPTVIQSGDFVDLQTLASSLVSKPVAFLAVVNTQGAWSTWTSSQAAERVYEPASDSPAGAAQPTDPGAFINGSALYYYRPLLADTSDNAASDDVPAQDPLQMYVSTSPYQPIDVAISPTDPKKLRPGATVRFTVTNANSSLTYAWDFGDGSQRRSGSTVSHIYNADCGCQGTVTATSSDGSVVGQAQPFVTISGTKATAPPPASPSPTPTQVVPGGGVGPAAPGGPPNQRPGPGKTPTKHPRPSASVSPVPTLSLPSLGQIGPRNPTGGLKPSVAPAVATPQPQVTLALEGDDGPLVSGQLIGSGVAVSAQQPAPVPQNAVAPAGRLSAGGRALVATGSGLVIMLLFAAGIVRERRGTRRRRSVVRAR
jgi:PKD repeat protein